jgi:predicted O-methyltransferase YrrM
MPLDARVLKLVDELEELRQGRDDHWQIPRAEGEVLYQLAIASRAEMIVEVGTSYGFSGLFLGAAARQNGGVFHTIDISQKKFDSSRETFLRAGLDKAVISHLGDAMQVLPSMRGPIDIAFLDGIDKRASSRYLELIWPTLRQGGSVLTDNTRTHPEELSDYVKGVRQRKDAVSTDLPVGNGLEWTIKVS